MSPESFKQRTKACALKMIKLTDDLSVSRSNNVMAGQLLRSGTSVGANDRAACRPESTADFISKMGTVEVECHESIGWMALLEESGTIETAAVPVLKKEGSEILAMGVASISTAGPAVTIRNPQ